MRDNSSRFQTPLPQDHDAITATEVGQPSLSGHFNEGALARRGHIGNLSSTRLDSTAGSADLAPYLPDHIGDPMQEMRLLELSDRGRTARRLWLDGVLHCSQQFVYSYDSSAFLSQSEANFSILFISGDDVPRLTAIIRDVRAILPSKLIVPVLSQVSRRLSVTLLQRGAADVLHCAMNRGEAVGRVHALQRRQQWSEARLRREADERTKLELELSALAHSPLTRKERMVLVYLSDHRDRTVPYYSLRRQASLASLNSLKVLVCKLRKKLVAGVTLRNLEGFGYKIIDKRVKASLNA